MQPLMFRCPRTGREIASGIEAQPDALMRLFSLRLCCPACGDLHECHVGAGLPPAHEVAGVNPVASAPVAMRATSHEVLRDLHMSDDEIAAYFHRFNNGKVDLSEHRRRETKRNVRAAERQTMQNMLDSFETRLLSASIHSRQQQNLIP